MSTKQSADAKSRYFDILMEKAKRAQGDIEEQLLDRIEKLLSGHMKEP